jgi:hypothetical protein
MVIMSDAQYSKCKTIILSKFFIGSDKDFWDTV